MEFDFIPVVVIVKFAAEVAPKNVKLGERGRGDTYVSPLPLCNRWSRITPKAVS